MSQPEFERRHLARTGHPLPPRPGGSTIAVLTCLDCDRQAVDCACLPPNRHLPVLYTRVVGTAATAEYDRSRW